MAKRNQTFCVKVVNGGRESVIATGADSLADAAEIAYRLTQLRQAEFGGNDEFVACPED